MVIGIDKFREYFKDFTGNYIIIGGTACDIILDDAGFTPRATKDIDIILIVEALKPEFVEQFWSFIKEGNYEYTSAVTVPTHVNIVGVNGTTIIRPSAGPAFVVNDGYVSIESLEILSSESTSGGAIELRNTSAGQEIRQINIRDNIIYGENDAPSIAFAPANNVTYIG